MKGQITARGKDTWRLRVDLGHDPVTGNRRIVSRTVHGNKTEGQRQLRAMIAENEDAAPGSGTTFGVLLAKWLEHRQPSISPATWARYEQAVRTHLTPALGKVKLAGLGAFHLDGLYRERLAAGDQPASVVKIHQVASNALSQAVKWGWLTVNPALRATPPKVGKSSCQAPHPDVVARIFSEVAVSDPDFAFYLHLAATTGARRGELCALRWSDLDPEARTLTIERASIVIKGSQVLIKGLKAGPVRRLTLPTTTVANFAAHRLRASERLLAGGLKLGPDDYVFPAERDAAGFATLRADRPNRPDGMTQRWGRLRVRCEAQDVRLHDLRHYAATELVTLGVDVKTVMQRCGWTTLATANRYIHGRDEADRNAADLLDRALTR